MCPWHLARQGVASETPSSAALTYASPWIWTLHRTRLILVTLALRACPPCSPRPQARHPTMMLGHAGHFQKRPCLHTPGKHKSETQHTCADGPRACPARWLAHGMDSPGGLGVGCACEDGQVGWAHAPAHSLHPAPPSGLALGALCASLDPSLHVGSHPWVQVAHATPSRHKQQVCISIPEGAASCHRASHLVFRRDLS